MIQKVSVINRYMYQTVFLCLFFQCIIESYHFKFKYTEKGPQMDIQRFGREFCVHLWFRWCLCFHLFDILQEQ